MTAPDVVLRIENVSKHYRSYKSSAGRIGGWLGMSRTPASHGVALDSINLSLHRGEAIALIGQNGAGKSTLLKIITGTVRPTVGAVHVGGRISAILELGLGFNPEFSGRENIMNSGGLLGFTSSQLRELMPEIESFAEIGPYFDAPVRTYSSGMQARLAFALATAVRPEILIVDEVLSVGDAYFQHKSFARIRQFRDAGTTLILVSHSLGDVRELCNRVVLIDKGRILRDGLPDEVIDYYNGMIAERENAKLSIEQRRSSQGWSVTRSGDFRAVVTDISLYSAESGDEVTTARTGEMLQLKVNVQINDDLPTLVFGLMIRDRTGHVVWGSNTWHTRQVLSDIKCGSNLSFTLDFPCILGPGSYSISPALVNSDTHLDQNFEWTDNLFVFNVINADKDYFVGTTLLDAKFGVEYISKIQ
ncbi:lipopolysaccharide ABC transporter, ATP-binding protein [Hyphomonas neptunium ATCC 15444]|uniref:Lipopolysaccharide ABC transporter, ATP-binding protein n=2 Tax=Hyphomonas TaxID=85 RepID=Q0C419_HYPNA|nr:MULTISPECIES: ABC transporter ATP-binding protein [Hyphomonas]ABI77736.1 lipopolysaccharide ABC transporter, ATP-binding protein [Hyphomonas neptunium ATCC 15444]KCZ96264.1 lipopolysaccharide ABC transporter ATP-binding protein [Hyphomonas hirschiana VP5]